MKRSVNRSARSCLLILCLLAMPFAAQAAAGKYVCENGKEVWKSNAELEAMAKPKPNPCTYTRNAPRSAQRTLSPALASPLAPQGVPREVLNLQLAPPSGPRQP
ncbi:hypothetical protein [Chitinilyticum litopenaei]|uniref:hypothetical protein n=1 Tax=Chitinilyticum litopenaei TaxID=1121276 RepID=UPI000400F170|nr:hypothetical protein [Chitinilyticum litopenaei]